MKKRLFFAFMLACAVLLVACMTKKPMPPNELKETTGGMVETTGGMVEMTDDMVENGEIFADAVVYVADAAMYRGTVTDINETADGTIVVLSQAMGIDFGSKTMTFLIDSMTTGDIDVSEGSYLEIFYGRPMQGEFNYAAIQQAIGINNLGMSAMVNFNGTILSIKKDGEKIISLTMQDMLNGQEVVFNVSSDTNIYLTESTLMEGDILNIFHRGMYTLSLPPQGSAIEIRYMSEY